MLKTTSHITSEIKTSDHLKDDLLVTLKANPGLHFHIEQPGKFVLQGFYYIKSSEDEIIDYFEIAIKFSALYPYCFPELFELANKIERIPDNHIDGYGKACVEFTYIADYIARRGIRIYEFVNYYVKKYFTWHIIKKHFPDIKLQEWKHSENAKKEFYLLVTGFNTNGQVVSFLEQFIKSKKVKRNDQCYCGSAVKLKDCHYETALFLKEIPRKEIQRDLLFLKHQIAAN